MSSIALKDLLDFHAIVGDSLNQTDFVPRIPDWLVANTRLKGRPWSFKDHEFQLEIVTESKREMACQKCSQVGLTETEIRRVLGFLSMLVGATAIYTLPTRVFAMKFAKSRVDPVIDGSPYLSSLVKSGSNGSEFKQIGSGSFYLGGAQNASQAISIPADYLVQDEIDFSNAAALSSYESRLRHSDIRVRRQFSTPTISGYGVNLLMDSSTQAHYTCTCSRCNTTSILDFFRDVVIPGFTRDPMSFDKADLLDPSVRWQQAYLACPKCRRSLDADLATPSARRWVHTFPSRTLAGFYVKPYDVIKYNSTSSVLEQVKGYLRRQDYFNFVHGITYRSDENEVNLGTVGNNTTIEFQTEGEGCFMGVDVGKKLYITITKFVSGKLCVLAVMTLAASDRTAEDLVEVYRAYGCFRLVMDAAPEWSLVKKVISLIGEYAQPCVYVEVNQRKPEAFYVKQEDHGMVMAARTTCFDLLVALINKGSVMFPRCDEMTLVKKHLHGMKRTEEYDDNGNKTPRWTKISDEDHYFHSLMYSWLAYSLDEPDILISQEVGMISILGSASKGESVIETGMSMREALELAGVSIGRRT